MSSLPSLGQTLGAALTAVAPPSCTSAGSARPLARHLLALLGLTEHRVHPVTTLPPSQQVTEPLRRVTLDRQVTVLSRRPPAKRAGDADLQAGRREGAGWSPSWGV